jgi:hypothetical protein
MRALVRTLPWLMLAVWCVFLVVTLQTHGLFTVLGFDYGVLWTAARAFAQRPLDAYDQNTLTAGIQSLAAFARPESTTLVALPAPYPPILLLALIPLGALAAPLSLGVWTVLNLAVVAGVIWHLAARLPGPRLQVCATVLAFFFPIVDSLILGQTAILMLAAIYGAYLAFERGDELQAGVLTGVLLLKPQYAVALVVVLLLKRRWTAMAGVGAVAVLLVVSSAVLLGKDGIRVYAESLRSVAGFRAVEPGVYPEYMISWRGMLANVLPPVPEATGLGLTAALTLATFGALPLIWRGPWELRSPQFARRFLATLCVTMLTSFHNHVYGAALLLVPGMILCAGNTVQKPLRMLLRVGLYAPPLLFLVSGSMAAVGTSYGLLFVAGIAYISAAEIAANRATVAPLVQTVTQETFSD